MANRGLWRSMSARGRRLLAVSWGVLFVCSLLLQFGLAPTALAVDPTDPPASASLDPSPAESPSTSPSEEAPSSPEASATPSASPSESPEVEASESPTPSPSTSPSPSPSASPSESPGESPSEPPEPIVTIAKTADHDAPVDVGTEIGFTVTVTNGGAADAAAVHVVDDLPTGFSWAIESQSGGLSWTIFGTQLLGDGSLAAGTASSVHITTGTDRFDCGQVPNTAVLWLGQVREGDASASEAVRCPALTIQKLVAGNSGGITPGGTPIAIIGDTLTYSLAYALVNGPVTNGVVTDVLPEGLEYVGGSATGNAEFTFDSYDVPTRTLRWTAASVTTGAPPSAWLTYRVDVTAANEDLPQPRVNVATISSTETPPDSDDQAVTVPTPELTDFQVVGVCDGNTPYLAYDFTVLNLPGADEVTITFLNPGGANVVYADQPLSGRVLWPGAVLDASGNVIDWPGWTLNPDGSWSVGDEFDWARPTVSILFEVNPSATLVAGYPPASPGCTDPPPELGILKSNDAPIESIDLGDGTSADLPTVNAGDTVTYTLTYNTNGVPQTNGLLTDVLPAGLTFVPGTASDSDEFTFQGYEASTRTLTWTAPTLTKGGTLTYDVTVDANAAGLGQPLINVATIVSDQQPADDDDSPVFVSTEPLGLTPPPTEALPAGVEPSRPGPSLVLILLATLGLTLAIGLITPIPERVRRRLRTD
ncbi:MAG TPA: hypothetical protein VH440_14285 [Candidatus Limnocylindrales bacterium]|jgi:uncharacterized repeat protein (TIGR01451 family)